MPCSSISLVILNACQTARHPVPGRAVQAWRGLDSAFLARGATAVISTLWSIADLPALLYSVNLHTSLADGAALTQAHASATSRLRNGTARPRAADALDRVRPTWKKEIRGTRPNRAYTWAAFRLSGACW